jgi:long-chain acyl-CoA synthetase
METRDYIANPAEAPRGTLAQLFLDGVDRFGQKVAFQAIKEDGSFQGTTFREAFDRAKEVAGGLRVLGLGRGDRAAILSENRPEWSQVDFGAVCSGIPLVPIHTNLSSGQIRYILEDSGVHLIFVSSQELLDRALEAEISGIRDLKIVLFDPLPGSEEKAMSWAEFLVHGQEAMRDTSDEDFRREALSVRPDDTTTILYTSGTTGDPKGVMLTHNNLFSNVRGTASVVPFDETDSTLSFLPLSHSLQVSRGQRSSSLPPGSMRSRSRKSWSSGGSRALSYGGRGKWEKRGQTRHWQGGSPPGF